MAQRACGKWAWAGAAIGVLAGGVAWADIIYTPLNLPVVPNAVTEVDLNGNGTADLRFAVPPPAQLGAPVFATVTWSEPDRPTLVTWLGTGSTGELLAAGVPVGTLIGPGGAGGAGYTSAPDNGSAVLAAWRTDSPIPEPQPLEGLWTTTGFTAILGVQLIELVGGGPFGGGDPVTRYAWIRITNMDGTPGGLRLVDAGVENTLDTPIPAGAVPGPGGAALALAATARSLRRRRSG